MRQRSVLVGLIAVSLVAVVAFALYNALYLGPAYSRLVVENAQKDAGRIAFHLSAGFFRGSGPLAPREITPAFRAAVAEQLAGYGLERLKAFAPDGTIVFSSVPAEEGTRNTRPYFHQIVARGRPHTVVVPRDGTTLEGRPVRVDVVESYVPIMHAGAFAGAFEIYFDVTDRLDQARDLRTHSDLIVLLMAGGLFTAVAVASRRAHQALRERDEANAKLHALSGHLHTAREEERTRVAREIHDELGQSLTAIKMELALLRRGLPAGHVQSGERAASLGALVESTTQAVKRISQDLRPGILDHLGLSAAVEWQAEEFEKRTGIPCDVTVDRVDADLDERRSTALFRILQEALTNTARHAGAGGVKVRLGRDGGDVVLQVQDDGRGLVERRRAPGSFGIIGMQERVRAWNGAVVVAGEPGRGTTVTVRLPLKPERAS
jgi:signal transduction histidine kinase